MDPITALDYKVKEMAVRIRKRRKIEGLTPDTVAEKTGVSVAEYLQCTDGTTYYIPATKMAENHSIGSLTNMIVMGKLQSVLDEYPRTASPPPWVRLSWP